MFWRRNQTERFFRIGNNFQFAPERKPANGPSPVPLAPWQEAQLFIYSVSPIDCAVAAAGNNKKPMRIVEIVRFIFCSLKSA